MVRTKGEAPLRQQQYGLNTVTQGLTDPLLRCHWFCCSYFYKQTWHQILLISQ